MDYLWGHTKRYNDFSTYFRKKFNGRVQKVSVDAGFSCPNRDGLKGTGGCSYCNNTTFKPGYCSAGTTVADQVREGIEFFFRKYNAMQFLAYFQAYSNTYAPLEKLRSLYGEALQHPEIIGLVIATRPDCLTVEILDYLEELSSENYVMLELGVESHRNDTLQRVNRGHRFEESVWALEETARRGIHNCAHLILGLPGETYSDFIDQAKIISQLPVENLKLHQLQVHKGTRLCQEYLKNQDKFHLFSVEKYIELVVDYLEVLNPVVVVERFVSEAPPDMVVAPKWDLKNFEFVAKVEKRLAERDTWQGRLFGT